MSPDATPARLRPYKTSDLLDASRVWFDSWRSTGVPASGTITQEELYDRFEAELQLGWSVTVAVKGDRIIGFMAAKPYEGLLDQLFIAPEAQGERVGTMLLEHARREMPSGFWLRTASDNEQAMRFYKARGLQLERLERHPTHGHPTAIYRSG